MASITTLTTVNALTKELYTGDIVDQMNEDAIGYKRVERTSEGVTSEVGGKYVTFPIRVRRNPGIGYREEDETLQSPGTQKYARVNIGLKFGYGRVKLSGPAMDLAESNVQSFASTLDEEMQGLRRDIFKDTSRIFYGNGTGVWATITGAATGQVIPVNDTTYFMGQEGAILDLLTPGSNTADPDAPVYVDPNSDDPAALNAPLYGALTVKQTVELAGVDVDNSTITVVGTATGLADGDVITRQGNYGREPHGLGSLVGTAKLFNVNPTAYPVWKSVINANGGTGRALSEALMTKMDDDVRSHGGRPTVILTSPGVRRAYVSLLQQQRRYNDTKTFAGGMIGVAFNNGRELPVVDDFDHPKSSMHFLTESDLKMYHDAEWNWMEKEGGIWKWVNNKDAYEAVMKKYWQMGIKRRNSQGRLDDLNEL